MAKTKTFEHGICDSQIERTAQIELRWNPQKEWWDAALTLDNGEEEVYSCGLAIEAIGWAASEASKHVQPGYNATLKSEKP